MLTEAVGDEIGRAALCWLVTEDARGRPTTLARDAWAAVGGAVAVEGLLSPGVLRLAVARLDWLDLEEDDLLPADRAAKGMALLRARETG